MSIDQGYIDYLKREIAQGTDWAQDELDRYMAEQNAAPDTSDADRRAADLLREEERLAADAGMTIDEWRRAEADARARDLGGGLPMNYLPDIYDEACRVMRSGMIGPADPSEHPLKLNDTANDAARELWARLERDMANDPGGILSAKANIKTRLLDHEAQSRDTGNDVVEAIRNAEPGNRAFWTSRGKPKCLALSRAVGRRVSSAERDKAYLEWRESQ